MIGNPSKLQPEHLQRTAYVYVRQSSPTQVHDHPESRRRQAELTQRAQQLGWPAERIVVLTTDLGVSATDPFATRHGFERLLSETALGRVGAIFSVDISRLARQDSEWHRLIEVAALTDTLLIDEQQIYHPGGLDDRLLLGLKGLLSSNEIRLMRLRLWENQLRKAQRGELRFNLPVGLVFDPYQGVRLDPDQQVQAAVQLLFERFRLSASISQVVQYFQTHGLQFPKHQGGWDGPLVWGPLTCQRVSAVLRNPLYAGAYVYGRVTQRAAAKPLAQRQQPTVRLPASAWPVALWDAFPGYIGQAEFAANQECLARHALPEQPRRRQDGPALLSGLGVCGRCGQRLHVVYSGADGQHVTYVCTHRQRRYAEAACQRLPGQGVDQVVTEAVLAALTPAQVELSLAVLAEVERQQAEVRQQWELRLEGAQYAARLAQRRYEQVDPENRLVARTLERQWEASLQESERLTAEYAQYQQHTPLQLDEAQREHVRQLVTDLPQVWRAETTTWAERKAWLRFLVADVTLTRLETEILVQIRWHTQLLDTYRVPLPPRGAPPVAASVVEQVRQWSPQHTDSEVAELLNRAGVRSAQGEPFTARLVQGLRRRYNIPRRPSKTD